MPGTDDPYKTVTGTYVPPQPEEPAQPARPLYRVIDPDGKTLDYKAERKDGVLTITAEADFAALTGTLGGIPDPEGCRALTRSSL